MKDQLEIISSAWSPLKTDDGIAFLFPSHLPTPYPDFPKDEIKRYTQWAKKLGLKILHTESLESLLDEDEWGEKSGAAQKRADYIINALNDPDVKVIFARGGHGADEVIHLLKEYYATVENLPKRKDAPPLIGFSDTTTLHLYLGQIGLVSPIQVTTIDSIHVQQLLFEQRDQEKISLIPVNDAAKKETSIEGSLIGGNASTISSARRTPYRLIPEEKRNNILLLEDWHTRQLITSLEHLAEQNSITHIKAIILGKCCGNFGDELLKDCILEGAKEVASALQRLQNSDIPLFFGAPFGHRKNRPQDQPLKTKPDSHFLPLPLNTHTVITTDANGTYLSITAARTTEDLESAKESYNARPSWAPYSLQEISTETYQFHSPITLDKIRPDLAQEATAPSRFIGCVTGSRCDIPALEGINLQGKNLLVHVPSSDDFIPYSKTFQEDRFKDLSDRDYWTIIQGVTMPLMELTKISPLQQPASITFSIPVILPQRAKECFSAFAQDFFPKTPIFTISPKEYDKRNDESPSDMQRFMTSEMLKAISRTDPKHPLSITLHKAQFISVGHSKEQEAQR